MDGLTHAQRLAIMDALPATMRADARAMADAEAVLAYCEGSIFAALDDPAEAGIDWPYGLSVERIRDLSQGWGDWLGAIAAAIEAAPIEQQDRDAWRVALSATKGLVMAYHVAPRSALW